MRILFLTSRLPFPPDRGDRVRTFGFLRGLGTEHEITLLSFIATDEQRAHVEEVAQYCTAVHTILLPPGRSTAAVTMNAWLRRSMPLQVLYYQSRQMRQLVDSQIALHSFDVAYAHLFRMAPYLARHRSLYRIVDFTDLISSEIATAMPYQSAAWQAVYGIELPRMTAYENEVAAWSDEAWFIAQYDRMLFRSRPHHAALHVIPNVLDGMQSEPPSLDANPTGVLFVGNLDVPHNTDAIRFLAREIMPLVWQTFPETTLNVVGAGSVGSILSQVDDPRIRIHGFVPDLNFAYRSNALLCAPLRFAAGTQNKVIEAMLAGLPVVLSRPVLAGLDAGDQPVALVANDAPALAAHIILLLRSPELRSELAWTAQDFVRKRYSTPAVVEHMRLLEQNLRP